MGRLTFITSNEKVANLYAEFHTTCKNVPMEVLKGKDNKFYVVSTPEEDPTFEDWKRREDDFIQNIQHLKRRVDLFFAFSTTSDFFGPADVPSPTKSETLVRRGTDSPFIQVEGFFSEDKDYIVAKITLFVDPFEHITPMKLRALEADYCKVAYAMYEQFKGKEEKSKD